MNYAELQMANDLVKKIREIDAKSKGLNNISTGAGDLMKELIHKVKSIIGLQVILIIWMMEQMQMKQP